MRRPRRFYLDIALISCAALLLEIGYTRLISFKLFYYYTYLIIGFALLGMGVGGVAVALSSRAARVPLPRFLSIACLLAAASIAGGYFVVALTPLNASAIWSTFREPAKLVLICAALFASFLAIGVAIAALLARHPDRVARLYCADLAGAGLGCLLVVPALRALTPPGCIFASAALLAAVAARLAFRESSRLLAAGIAAATIAAAVASTPRVLPEPVTDGVKSIRPESLRLFTRWDPVFRVDVTPAPVSGDALRLIHHDGLWGSAIHRFGGSIDDLARFETDDRSYPFKVLGRPPERVLIVGAAGGHEILAALRFGAGHVTAVELNPVTVSLVTDVFADYSGHLATNPRVTLVNDEARAFLARSREHYDLIFFVAPDSYAASNAATAGAFVLSESYLYTVEMLLESIAHLTPDGLIAMQFGEIAYDAKPNRTARYAATAREAWRRAGIERFADHVLVATTPSLLTTSTILLKPAPYAATEVERFLAAVRAVPNAVARHAPGTRLDDGRVNAVIDLPDAALEDWHARQPYDLRPVTDDAPFFWHFTRFRDLFRAGGGDAAPDPEDGVGERLLLALLAVAVSFATVFLLLPFVAVRATWRTLPSKRAAAVYFGGLGLGFMFYEIALMQKLTLFLGYPTYSLTVTLAAMLVTTGLGSLLSVRSAARPRRALPVLLGLLVGMTLFYQLALEVVTAPLLGQPLVVRALAAAALIAPLGLTLGTFLPLGLATVAQLGPAPAAYVAWSWAVNGFASVVGSVLAALLSMTFGFRVVLGLALGLYAVAAIVMVRLAAARASGAAAAGR